MWLFIALTMLSGVVNAAKEKKQTQQPPKQQKERLAKIEKYIAKCRQATED